METLKYIFKKISNTVKKNFKETSDDETFSLAQAIAKALIYAKENDFLPSVLEPMAQTPEDIASLSAKIAFSLDASKKLVNGDLNTYEKLLNHIIDIAYVIAVSTANNATSAFIEVTNKAIEIVVELFAPGWGEIVGNYLDSISIEISKALKSLNVKLLNKFKFHINKNVQFWFESLRIKQYGSAMENNLNNMQNIGEEDEEEEEIASELEYV